MTAIFKILFIQFQLCFIQHFNIRKIEDEVEIDEDIYLQPSSSVRVKIVRNSSDPLDLPSDQFFQSFRIDKDLFRELLDLLQLKSGVNVTYIPPAQRLAIVLNYLGGAGYQHQLSKTFNAKISQSKTSSIISELMNELENNLCSTKIKFEVKEETKIYFYENFKLPGVIGCIKGTHIMILKPPVDESMYFNKRGKHSINVMVICDEKYRIMAINPTYGGASPNSFVWQQSDEKKYLERAWQSTRPNNSLLGDGSFPLHPYLITPYRNAKDDTPEALFNSVHTKAHSIVDRCVDIMKNRWRVLLDEKKCRYAPGRVAKVANVCAALHNMCIERNINLPEDEEFFEDEDFTIYQNISTNKASREAEEIRNNMRDSLAL